MSQPDKSQASAQSEPPPTDEARDDDGAASAPAEANSAEAARPARGDDEPAKSTVLPQGNPLRLARGGITALVGGFLAFCLMGADAQFRWGVPAGILGVAAATFGILDLLGTFDDPDERVAKRTTLAALQNQLLAVAGSFAATMVLIGFTSKGTLPITVAAFLIPAAFLALIASVFQLGVALGPLATDENGEPRPLLRRHGFWVLAAGTLLYLPMQGSYSLSDPWETHYGEVAREMLSRNDWISTWWAQDGWFWSKPVLDFWMQGLAMGIFGVNYHPGQMLAGAAHGHTPRPEWAVRMPVFILTIVGLYFLYKGVAKVFGRRPALIGALVLATMPQWFLLAHQTITDMPLVSTLSASMGLALLGMHTDAEQRVRVYEVAIGKLKLRLSGYHLVLGVVLMSALPQILYLASRNLELQWLASPHGFRPHLDEFWSGSAGNCGLPGNEQCNRQLPYNQQFQPMYEALLWGGVVGVILWMNWGERRLQRLFFLGAWYFAAVSTLGKGPAGFGLPIAVTFTYIAATRKWDKLLSFEVVSGLLVILAVAIPWYVAMYMRHGQPFTDRLLFHDMYKRAFTHVHDTNEGDDVSFRFYIWQLGYAMFLWTGLVPAGLVFWARRRDDADRGRGDVSVFLAMWFCFAFALFTAMLTKFHHYIFPAVPPAAMLTGIVVDRMIGAGKLAKPSSLAKYLVGTGVGAVVTMYGFVRLFPGRLNGAHEADGSVRAASMPLAVVCILGGLALAVLAIRTFGRPADDLEDDGGDDEPSRARRHENLMLAGVGLAAAVVTGLVGRDLATSGQSGDVQGQARLLHLFTYNYRRAWPDSLEFSGVMAGVAVFATACMLFLAIARFRRHVAVMLCAASLGWAVWGLDVYLVRCAPHWGQREVIERYYELRKGPEQPIVAYQMNWKGENFYTGNHIPAFVSSGQTFTNWIKAQREKGTRTFFFVTEHGRIGSLKNELGNPPVFQEMTDKKLNNKFALVKAEFTS